MKVKSIAECSFDLHEATVCHKDLFFLFLSGRYTQVLLLNTHADISSRARGLHLHPCLCIHAAKVLASLCICAGLPEPLLLDSIMMLVKSVYHKNNFLISQPKHMLWVLKRTISIRRFSISTQNICYN